MENPQMGNSDNVDSKRVMETMINSTSNMIVNHDFSQGLNSWHLNYCDGFVVSPESGYNDGMSAKPGGTYAVVTNRTEDWQGLEQDITTRVSPGCTYTVSARVGVSGSLQGFANVLATLRLKSQGAETKYLFVGRTSVSKGQWEKLEGSFSLSDMPDRAIFYFEGPSPGVDLLIKSAFITSSNSSEH